MKQTFLLLVTLFLTTVGCKGSGSSEPETDFALKAPTDFKVARIGQSAVKLTWNDANTQEVSYSIERRLNEGAFAPRIFTIRDVTVAVDSLNLFVDSTYVYRVRAIRYSEAGPYSNEVTIKLTK